MKEQILENEEVRESLDTMMAMALIRGVYKKKMISKNVMENIEINCKKRLKKTNKCANIKSGTNVGTKERD